jgi:hypothetical protein
MVDKIDWNLVRGEFEKEMAKKLEHLPGHDEVAENQKGLRNIISHELPETASPEVFEKLINILLTGGIINEDQIRKEYLEPELVRERELLERKKERFAELKISAREWVLNNLSEDQLQADWKEHKTWLPRRYTIYNNPNISFQEITGDTLARYALGIEN